MHTYGNSLTGGQFGARHADIGMFNSLGALFGNRDDFGGFRLSNIPADCKWLGHPCPSPAPTEPAPRRAA